MIGQWDNSGCVFGVLPRCLKLGTNPADFNSGLFPVYQGSSAPSAIMGTMDGGLLYESSIGGLNLLGTGRKLEPVTFTPTADDASSFTIVGWLDVTGVSGVPYIVNGNPTGTGNTYITLIWGITLGTVQLSFYKVGSSAVARIAAKRADGFVPTGIVQIVATKSGANLRVYSNGIECTAITLNTPYTAGSFVANGNLRLGAENKGIIHNTLWYDRALSDAEILALYNLGPDLGGLYGYDKGDGTMGLETAHDTISPVDQSPVIERVTGGDPHVMLQYSDDGGYTWSKEYWRGVGRIGKRTVSVKWNRLGTSEDRVFRVRHSAPTKCVFISAKANVDVEQD